MTFYRGDSRATATPCNAEVMIDWPLVEIVLAGVLAASMLLAFLVWYRRRHGQPADSQTREDLSSIWPMAR
jgi:hypothetical protein